MIHTLQHTSSFSWWEITKHLVFSLHLSKVHYTQVHFVLKTSYRVLLRLLDIISRGNICALNLTLLFLHIQPALLHLKGHYSIALACFRSHYRAFDTLRTARGPQGCLRILVSINQILRWILSTHTEEGSTNVKVLLPSVMKHGLFSRKIM